MRFLSILIAVFIFTGTVQARPISYPGGWTIMSMNDPDMNALHVFYSPSAHYSVGLNHEYRRESGIRLDAAQFNYLARRWNNPDSQGNLYLDAGIGTAGKNGAFDPAAYAGLAADWENRRLFTSYANRFLYAGSDDKSVKHEARIGVAPYIGDYGDIHTWLMLQADYDAGADDNLSITPLIRLFKGTALVEAGYNLDGGILFNAMFTF